MIERSSLQPDDLDEFEKAAQDRPDQSPLTPPYDPGELDSRMSKSKKPVNATDQLRAVLRSDAKYRLRVFRGHLKWARKMARAVGIDVNEVNLWEI